MTFPPRPGGLTDPGEDPTRTAARCTSLLVPGLLAAIGLLAVAGLVRALPILLGGPDPIDFAAYYLAARVLRAGGDIYAQVAPAAAAQLGVAGYTAYIYPPQLAWLLGGLAALPYQSAASGWLLADLLVACVTVVALGWHFQFSRLEIAIFTAGYLTLPATYNILISGQVLLWLNLLLALILILAAQPHTRPWRAVLGGVLLAAAALTKVYPAVAGLALLLQRRWLVLAAAGVTTIIGVTTNSGDTRRWFAVVLPELARTNAFPTDQSLLAVSGRLFSVTRFVLPGASGAPPTHVELEPFLNAPQVGPVVGYLAILIVGAVTLLSMVRTPRSEQRHPFTFELCFAVALAAALLVSPIAWSEYAVHLLIPFMVLVRWRWLAFPYGLLPAAAYLLLVLEKHWSFAVTLLPAPSSTMFSFGAALLVWLALVWTVYRPPGQAKAL